jgi:hypothetical protein
MLLIPVHVYQPILYESRMQIALPLAFVSSDACMINNIPLRNIYHIHAACGRGDVVVTAD